MVMEFMNSGSVVKDALVEETGPKELVRVRFKGVVGLEAERGNEEDEGKIGTELEEGGTGDRGGEDESKSG